MTERATNRLDDLFRNVEIKCPQMKDSLLPAHALEPLPRAVSHSP